MTVDKCKFCGGHLVLHVEPDDSVYQQARELLKKADMRFIGERYFYTCDTCGRTGRAFHRDDMPNIIGEVTSVEIAKRIARSNYDEP